MSTEPIQQQADAPTVAVSAIENELPAYRAISPRAVAALILGVLSVLSFASWYFLTLASAAVLVGFLADRKIQRYPDVLTGRGMAQAGVGLGLIFGLTAVSVSAVQDVIRARQARAFASVYQDILRNGSFDQAVWYTFAPAVRANYTPEALVKEVVKQTPGGADAFDTKQVMLRELKRAINEPGADLHFDRIENHGEDELTPFAGLVYEVHTPRAKAPADRERYALAVAKAARNRQGRLEWWIDEVAFPYVNKSFTAPKRVIKDDGHGHSH